MSTVLYLCDYKAPYGGNFIASLNILGNEMKNRGNTVLYAFPKDAEERPWMDLLKKDNTVLFVSGGTKQIRNDLCDWIRSYGIDIIHAHFGFLLPARLAALKNKNVLLVIHQHSDFSSGKKPGFKKRLKIFGVDVLNLLLGKRLRQIYVGTGMKLGRNGVCIPNALVEQRFTDEILGRKDERRILGLADSDCLCLLFGWSPEIKGVDIAVRAFDSLWEQGHAEMKLGIVLGRDFTLPKMKAWIMAKTGVDSNDPRIFYLDPIEDVFRYHQASDIMLSASRSETFSYALLEALYIGNPCVISDIPGTKWAEKYATVFSFQTENPDALAGTLLDVSQRVRDRSLKEESNSIADSVQKEYDIQCWLEKVIEVYSD